MATYLSERGHKGVKASTSFVHLNSQNFPRSKASWDEDSYDATPWYEKAQNAMVDAGPGYLPVSAILAIVEETAE